MMSQVLQHHIIAADDWFPHTEQSDEASGGICKCSPLKAVRELSQGRFEINWIHRVQEGWRIDLGKAEDERSRKEG